MPRVLRPMLARPRRPAARVLPASAARLLCGSTLVVALLGPLAERAGAQPAVPATAPAAAEEAYDAASALLAARLYASARDAFARFRADFPDHPRAPEALFHEAEAALAAGDDEAAAERFARFRATWPGHALAPRAALALGEHYLAHGDAAGAEAALREALDAPGAALPDDVRARARYLAGLAAREQGRGDAALSDFDRVVAEFPASAVAPQALYAAGAIRAEGEDWEGAASDFERLSSDFPDTPENQRVGPTMGEAYARLGRFDEAALELARRRPSLAGDEAARADFLLGDALLRLDRRDDARGRLLLVPEDGPYGRRARFALARLDYDGGDFASAAAGFAAVRAQEGDDLAHEATFYEGLALKQSGELGEAERRLADATLGRPDGAFVDAALLELGLLRFERRQYEEAAQPLEALLRDYPRSAHAGEAARMLGEAYAALGDAPRAREAVRRAEALGVADPELSAEVDFQEAYAHYRAGRFDEAAAGFRAVHDADPNGPRAGEALFWSGEALFQAEEYGRADETLSEFLGRFPDHRQADPARYVLAWTHFKRRDYARAAPAFEGFLSTYRDDQENVPYVGDATLRLADSYYALGRYEDAAAVYARVGPTARAEADSSAASGGEDYALFQTGQAWAAAERTADALAAWDRILTEFPASELRAEALVARGALLAQTDDPAGALAAYTRVLDEMPTDALAPKALVGMGDVHFNAGRAGEAEAAYRRVLEGYPRSPFVADALDGLGAALAEQGRSDELAEAVAEFEARNPDPAARDRLRLRQAELAVEGGDYDGALGPLEALSERSADPDVPPRARFALGEALAGLGEFVGAAESFGRVPPEHALHAEAVLRQAEALLAADEGGRAAEVLIAYETRFPEDAELIGAALLAESRALAALGRTADAQRRRARLLDAFAETAAAAEARAEEEAGETVEEEPIGETDGGE